MTRQFGLLCFLIGVMGLALWLFWWERRRVAEYEGLCCLVHHIGEQMASYSTPLPDIYRSFDHPALAACGFLAVLRKDGLSAALKQTRLSADQESLTPLVGMAEGIGQRLSMEEIACYERTERAMLRHLSAMKEALPQRERLAFGLCFCGGMMLLILLI